MKFSFKVFGGFIDSALLYVGNGRTNVVEFTCKNQQIYIAASNEKSMFAGKVRSENLIGFGDFTFVLPAFFLKDFLDEICKVRKMTITERRLTLIDVRMERDESGNVYAVLVNERNEIQSIRTEAINYRENLYGSLVYNIPFLVGQNDPENEEATHLSLDEYKRARKVRQNIYLRPFDPIFKQNGWSKPAFIFDDQYIIIARGYREPENFSKKIRFWGNV